jgi:hypothetical protein
LRIPLKEGIGVKCEETLPIINKSKHPKKGGGIQGIKRNDPIQEDKRTTKQGQTSRDHQVCKPPPLVRSISNNEGWKQKG